MTNFEYYKKEILEITNNGDNVAVRDDKPIACESLEYCTECEIKYGDCQFARTKWFCAEHIEQPKLTKKERQFCELVETGWIARDGDGLLVYYVQKPKRGDNCWIPYSDVLRIDNRFPYIGFPFIKWEDKKPWSIEDLLKLEVEE